LIFSDYGRAPIRLAAIMEIPVVYIFTMIPSRRGRWTNHQRSSSSASLRAIPGLVFAAGRREMK